MKIGRDLLYPATIWSLLIALAYLWVAGSEVQCAYFGGSDNGCDPKSLAYFMFPNSIVPLLADAGLGRLSQFLILAVVDVIIILLLMKFVKYASGSFLTSVVSMLAYIIWSLVFGLLMTYLYFSHAFDVGVG
jgi:hypothetical protein